VVAKVFSVAQRTDICCTMAMLQVGTDSSIAFLQTMNWTPLYIVAMEVLVLCILDHS
jgi:hypothetical protein